ncbi:hypothetical protein PAT3040_00709 [Paenibacillus agaridevorans]|uniref:CD-NTase-associated protein 15 domain-containing protein n=1 Tax=Paenibacillus agaridevorans TaxID=171404 RepID=A0A2R5EHY1_9BACL|nr:hypothetical protein [Paenibacillus agaridevorans]GBG06196.1 hypothetical protein PAT3040_00709 [Paenibacillus agaridevorans]
MYNQDNYNKILVTVGIVAFCLSILIVTADISDVTFMNVFKSISTATLITFIFHFVFKKWIWQYQWIPLLNPLIVLVPNLHGTWEGTLRSNWTNPETGKAVEPKKLVVFIRQTFVTISVEIHTDEMISKSYLAGFRTDLDTQTHELCYTYTSKASANTVSFNPWHDGTAKLEIHQNSTLRLKGDYWTLRETTGTIEIQRVSKKILR